MPAALPDLAIFVILFGALIVCYLAVYFVKAFLGTAASATSWIPWIGSAVSSGLHKAEQHVTNIFGKAAAGVQSAMGWSWHLQARLIDALGREINSHANQLWTLANSMPAVAFVAALLSDLRKHTHSITKLWDTIFSHPASLVKPLTARVGRIEKYAHANVKALDHALDGVIEHDIPSLKARTKKLEGEVARAWDAIKAGKFALGSLAFVGAVALALSKLGMGWLRCNSAVQFGKKRGCGLWNDLESILGLLADAVAITNICVVIPWLEEAFSVVAAPLVSTLASAGAGLCKPGSSPPAELHPPALHVPASSSLTLYLP